MKYFEKLKQNSMLARRMRDSLKLKAFAFFVLALIAAVFMFSDPVSSNPVGMILSVVPVVSFAAFAKKEGDLSLEEKQTIGTIEAAVQKCLSDYAANTISQEDYKTQMKSIDDKLKELGDNKDVGELRELIKDMSSEIQKMKSLGINPNGENPIVKKINEFLDSEKFKEYVFDKTKSSGSFTLDLKEVVSFANNYTGTALISQQQQDKLQVQIQEKRVNFRDLMMVDQGDPAFPMLTWPMIYDLDRNASFVSENGRLSESSFKMKEESSETKRVGTYLTLSKRLLKSRVYIQSWLLNRLRNWVMMAEDFQIMFGDGTGNNLKGITKYDGVKCVSKVITDTVVSGEAGSIKGAESYDNGDSTIVEFTIPHDNIVDGQKITIAGVTTFTDLNGEHVITKINDRKIKIDVAFKKDGVFSAATFSVKNNFFNTVSSPDLGDAVKAIFAVMTYAEYTPNMIALNPSTLFEIECEKDTMGRNLNLVTMVGGVKYIAGRPIKETTALKPGYYFSGDMANGASLVDYSSLSIEFADDVESKLKNQTNVICSEEIIMPVYNPWSFSYGKLSDVLTAIAKS